MRIVTLVLTSLLLPLAGCATMAPADPAVDPTAGLEGAQVNRRTADNGDLIEEYRVAGQLHVVKITPLRGTTYYLIDRNGDGLLDSSEGEGPVSPVYWKLFEWN